MDRKEIIIIAAALVAVSIRLYRNYAKKNKDNAGTGAKQSSASFPSNSRDDDYEPYSKK